MLIITNQLILDQIPAAVAWKDTNLKYIGANKSLIIQMKLNCREELIGISDDELTSSKPTQNAIYRQHDLLALQGHTIEIMHTLESSTDNKTYFLQKKPLRNEEEKIIGVLYHCLSWQQENLLTSLKQIDKKFQPLATIPDYYNLNANDNPAELSQRELECLFLQLRGKTAKQIGEILKLSKRTVESYTENIKSKLGCMNKAELLVTAIEQGYQKHVPKSLIDLNLIDILKD
jgi:DNA-binding CsgD family transcriptional regulator